MERFLKVNDKIELKGIDGSYIIKDIIGRGSSCVVYSTEFYNENGEKTEHLLKEFNPKCIDLKRQNGELKPIKNEDAELFELLLKRFKDGFDRQAELRSVPELKNYTANIQNTYYDHGTIYIDMTETEGRSYAEVKETSLYNLAQRIRVLTQVIGNYHKRGYLHLDIKPSNIFVRPEKETCEDVLLFDCDSLVPLNEVNNGINLSYTLEWAPIELTIRSKGYTISKATDIFSIGEIFFEKLMGRHSKPWERRSTSKYAYDLNAPIFENTNPKVLLLLDELFRHTLCNNLNDRYQTTDELIGVLDRIVSISNPKEPYLLSSFSTPQSFFVGRDKEIDTIHGLLNENKVLFLSGMGGIGKSELAKNFVRTYRNDFDEVIFAPYTTDFNMLFASDEAFPIANVSKYPAENLQDYAMRKFRKFKELCDEKTLIIIDNFNTTEDDKLQEILKLNCHILITTRVDFSEFNYAQYEVEPIADKETVLKIFHQYYTKPLTDEELLCVDKIIDITFSHTMTIELLSKQMMAGRITPQKMLNALKEKGISNSGKEKVNSNKDDKLERMSAFDHIQALFDLSELDDKEQFVLANLSLMPYTGISIELFHDWCELVDYDTINSLVLEGWIREDKENDIISLHPIVAEVVFDTMPDIITKWEICLNNARKKRIYKYSVTAQEKVVFILLNMLEKVYIIKSHLTFATEFLRETVENMYNWRDIDLLKYIKWVVDSREKTLGEENALTIIAYYSLADYYKRIAEYLKSEVLYERVLNLLESLAKLKGKDLDGWNYYQKTYRDLAFIYSKTNRFDLAKEILEKQIHYFCGFPTKDGSENRYVTILKFELGTCHKNVHEYDTAILYYEHCLLEFKKWQTKSTQAELRLMGCVYWALADCYNLMGVIDRSLEYVFQSKEMFEKIDGNGSKNHIIVLQLLGELYLKSEKFEMAEEHLLKCLEMKSKLLGDEHYSNVKTWKSLAELYKKKQEENKALYYAKLAFEKSLESFGENDRRTISAQALYLEIKQ